jgi:hypothetical protein
MSKVYCPIGGDECDPLDTRGLLSHLHHKHGHSYEDARELADSTDLTPVDRDDPAPDLEGNEYPTAEDSLSGSPSPSTEDTTPTTSDDENTEDENTDDENTDDMVSPEEYEQQNGESGGNGDTEGGTGDSPGDDAGGSAGELRPADDFLPGLSLTTYVLLASAVLAAFMIYKVWQVRSADGVEQTDVDENDDDDGTDAVDRDAVSMLE